MSRFYGFVLLAASLQVFVLRASPQDRNSTTPPVVGCTCKRVPPRKNPGPPPPPPRPHPSTFNLNVEFGNPSQSAKEGCHPETEHSSLADAKDKFDDGNFDQAVDQYQKLIKSCDDKTRDAAIAGYALSRQKQNTWWWQKGKSHPWLLWPFLYPILFLILCMILVGLLFALSDRLLVRVPLSWGRRLLQWIFMPPFLGQATIIAPVDLGKEAQASLFAASLQSNARLARELMSGDQVHLQVRSSNLLSIPSAVGRTIFEDLPEVGGVKLGSIAQFLLGAGQYLGWRVETQLAFYPSAVAGESCRMLAVSTLRWAWFSDDPIRIERDVRDAQDVDDIAFAVAARILGRYFVAQN